MKFDIWEFFGSLFETIQVSLKSDKSKGHFTWDNMHFLKSYLAGFVLEWEMFQAKVVGLIVSIPLCRVTT
jgi:hypothetical protein